MNRKPGKASGSSGGGRNLRPDEIAAMLRGVEDLQAGRDRLVRLLKGEPDRKLLERGLNENPVFGLFETLPEEEIAARVDWLVTHGYLRYAYGGREPVLAYTPEGWAIEQQTHAAELISDFDDMIAAGRIPADMAFLQELNREVAAALLERLRLSGDPKYVPILRAWAPVEDRKQRTRIEAVIAALQSE